MVVWQSRKTRISTFNSGNASNQSDLSIYFPIVRNEVVIYWLKIFIGSLGNYKDLI